MIERLLPLQQEDIHTQQPEVQTFATVVDNDAEKQDIHAPKQDWSYIYEPDAQTVIDDLLVRYVESLIYQAVVENMASE